MKTIKWLVLAVILSGSIVAASILYNNLSKDYAGNNLEIYGKLLYFGSSLFFMKKYKKYKMIII